MTIFFISIFIEYTTDLILVAVCKMAVSRRDVRKILKPYKTPWFPGSYSSPQKFIRGVRDRLRIDLGLRELKDILEKNLAFQMSKVKPLNPNKRRIVSNS